MDKDIELLKIQIYSEYCHSSTTANTSILLVFLSLVAVFYGFFFQGLITENFGAVLIGLTGVISVVLLTWHNMKRIEKRYSERFKILSEMIEAVKEGKELPKLEELEEWKKEK